MTLCYCRGTARLNHFTKRSLKNVEPGSFQGIFKLNYLACKVSASVKLTSSTIYYDTFLFHMLRRLSGIVSASVFVMTLGPANTRSIMLFMKDNSLKMHMNSGYGLWQTVLKALSTTVQAPSSVALLTVCMPIPHFINDEAIAFALMASGSGNTISWDRDFTTTLMMARCNTHPESLSATATPDLAARVRQRFRQYIPLVHFSWDCSYIGICQMHALFKVRRLNVVHQYTVATIQTIEITVERSDRSF